MPGARAHPAGSKMCPSPVEACGCARPAEPCPGARFTAARLREIGDELQRDALGRASPGAALAWKHLSAACLYVLWAVTPTATLALLIRRTRDL